MLTHEDVATAAKMRGAEVFQLRNPHGNVILTIEPAETNDQCRWLWVEGHPTFLFSRDVERLVAALGGEVPA